MNLTQEQAQIIYDWWRKLLASNNTAELRGSDYTLARVIYDASQQLRATYASPREGSEN